MTRELVAEKADPARERRHERRRRRAFLARVARRGGEATTGGPGDGRHTVALEQVEELQGLAALHSVDEETATVDLGERHRIGAEQRATTEGGVGTE